MSNKNKKFSTLGNLVVERAHLQSKGYISQEFQDFAYRLAVALNDLEHKSLYMRLAKQTDRVLLERALSYVSDADNARSKAKLFMWKLTELKKERREREADKSEKATEQPSLF